jgi:hypothetical protein
MTNRAMARTTRISETTSHRCKCGKNWAMPSYGLIIRGNTRKVFIGPNDYAWRRDYECDCGKPFDYPIFKVIEKNA